MGFPGGSNGKESACNAGGPGSIPGSGRREWLLTPLFLPGEFHGQRSLLRFSRVGHDWTTKPLLISSWRFCSHYLEKIGKWKWLHRVQLFAIPRTVAPASLLCPWNSPGKNTEVGSRSLLQIIFPTQGSNLGLLHCRQILHHLSHQGSSSLKHIPKVLLPPRLGLRIWTCEFWGNTAFKWMRLCSL